MGAAREGGGVIAAAPEAGGEVGVLSGFGLALLSLLMWMALRGLRGIWQLTFGAIFDSIANVKIGVKYVGSSRPFAFVGRLNRDVLNALDTAAQGYEGAMGYWFHASARLQGWLADETWKIARDTLHFGEFVVRQYGPLLVKTATTVGFPWPKLYAVIRSEVAKALPKAGHVAHSAARAAVAPIYRTVAIPHLGELQWIHRHWKALTAALGAAGSIALAPGLAIPRVWHGIDELRHRLGRIEKRLTKVEGLFGATALALAMANVLGIPNPRCLRKGPIGKVARRLCGLGTGALDDLLGLLVDVFIVEDICKVIELLNEGLGVLTGPLASITGVVDAALCGGDYDRPPKLPPVKLYLPPSPALILSGV